MTAAGRGIRNAFRNAVRTISVVLILGLAIGLSVVMLIAHHSVTGKIATTFSSIGNTVTIGPSGYPADGQPAKNLTTAELAPIANLHGVTSIDETLNGTAAPARTSLRPATFSPAVYFSGIDPAGEPGEHRRVGAQHRKRPCDLGHESGGRRHGRHGHGPGERAEGRLDLHCVR